MMSPHSSVSKRISPQEALRLPQIDLSNELKRDAETEQRLFEVCRKTVDSWTSDEIAFIQLKSDSFNPNQYSHARFESGFFTIKPSPDKIQPTSELPNTVLDIDATWDPRKFEEPRAPFCVGKIDDTATYDSPGTIRCLHLPIKFPGTELRVPNEYQQFAEALIKIINFESAINRNYNEYHAYLTVDQRFVPAGATQRLPGAHVDGLPRDRDNPFLQKIDHSYLITNNLSTLFYVHPFPLAHYDLNKHNFFAAMRCLANPEHGKLTAPYEITLMNAYSVHSTIPATLPTYRTFIRLEFSVLEFDRKGNAINPFFNYNWTYKERPLPPHLVMPEDLKDLTTP